MAAETWLRERSHVVQTVQGDQESPEDAQGAKARAEFALSCVGKRG